MPTTQQLHDLWEMELNLPSLRREDDPMYVKPTMDFNDGRVLTGKVIGHIEIDPETKDIKIIVD